MWPWFSVIKAKHKCVFKLNLHSYIKQIVLKCLCICASCQHLVLVRLLFSQSPSCCYGGNCVFPACQVDHGSAGRKEAGVVVGPAGQVYDESAGHGALDVTLKQHSTNPVTAGPIFPVRKSDQQQWSPGVTHRGTAGRWLACSSGKVWAWWIALSCLLPLESCLHMNRQHWTHREQGEVNMSQQARERLVMSLWITTLFDRHFARRTRQMRNLKANQLCCSLFFQGNPYFFCSFWTLAHWSDYNALIKIPVQPTSAHYKIH